MVEKFNGIVYLIIFIVHFLVYAVYAFRTVVGTKAFMDQYKIDHSAAVMVRFFGAAFIGSMSPIRSATVTSGVANFSANLSDL